LTFTKPISQQKSLFTSLGVVLETAFVRGEFDVVAPDTIRHVMINEYIPVKPYTLLHLEVGYKKITQKNKIHQISLQLFYGLKNQMKGVAYHTTKPSSTFNFVDKGHFASLQYTFWFGKKLSS
jgi:hypothetical protein